MSPQTVTGEHVPTLEAIEEAAARIRRELDRTLEHLRGEFRALQDAEAELADGWSDRAKRAHYRAAYRLRRGARCLTRAQLELVLPTDPRASAIPQVREYLSDAEARDRPWRDAA